MEIKRVSAVYPVIRVTRSQKKDDRSGSKEKSDGEMHKEFEKALNNKKQQKEQKR
ncbi:hypothetical protein CLHUN_41530 [Ruminiclostridium hungatei]|uniref:Uncharacterized protein n=1 Tax=Ruminiclostridium hungatei TaxID=48256 RepID=A0A1V4SDJ2_RUMHU|nr:hypothetical protein [Ruminiclostridium hungatei]OPX41982.1 hypothetical protein CLHUN_41530 [Ruminiclostridium hungatei]